MKNQENKKLGGDENPYISLKVKGIGEKEVLFRIKRGTQLKKLMNAYCNMKYFDFYSIMFLFNGYQLRAEQTPLELDMEDGDEIEVVIDAIDDDEQDDCCSTHLIDEDGTFNAIGLDNFIKKVKLGECGISYVVVAIMGAQSSGKSTLLNHLFHTNFWEMDAYKGRSQTTKGIWIARCAGIEPSTIVMDLEGTNGREIGEDDTAFGKQSALFALAVSDIVLINMWCHDIGLEQAANTPLLKTVFQVMLRLSVPRKTSLLFVIRDKTRTPLEILEPVLREDIQKIWDFIPKPEAHKHTPLSIFFNVQVVALSSYEDKEEQFKEQVVGFRQKFFQSITPGGLAADRRGVVPASGFSFSVQQIWKVIKENKDLDLVAHKVMVATVRCDEIAKKKYSSFVSNKEWIELQKILQSLFIPSLGVKLSSLLYNCLSSYDEETSYFEDSVRSAKRRQLEENLMQLVQPAYQLMLGHILPEMLENFKKALNDALGGGLGFAVAARDCSKEFIRLFDEKYGIKQIFWDLAKVRDKLSCDLDSQIAEIRNAKLSELSSLYESEMKEALYGPVKALLKGGRDDTWPAIRNLLHQETAKSVSEFSIALSGFEISKQEKEDIISSLKNYSRGLVEGKAREAAGKVLYHMKERFTYIIKHDDDSMPQAWSGKEDIQAITKNAQSSSLSLLSMLAAIRLDGETDTIRDTLVLTLMDPRIGNSKSYDLRDPLASSTWEEVPASKTLITPAECKSLWNQFKKETEYTVAQPIASQMPHAMGSSLARVPSTLGGDNIPSSSLRERNTSSRGPCTSGTGPLHDFGERGGKGGSSFRHPESLNLDDMMNTDCDILAEELEVGLDGDGVDLQGSQTTQTSRRGKNVRPLPPVNLAHRREISIERDGGFNITKATRMCTTILRECFQGPWCYWSEVPRENRQIMFERFAANYRWDPSLDEAIYRRWEYVNSVRLRDMLREARWKAAKVARKTTGGVFEFPTLDFEVIRAFNPSWIRAEDWNAMIDRVWNTEEWKAKARAAQANRNTKHGETSARHTGGSISFSQHRIRMREETGVEPELDEVFMRTHTRIDPVTGERTWPYPKAREVYEAYKKRNEGALSPCTTQVDSGNLWKQIAGSRKKGRIFGTETSTDSHNTPTDEPEMPNTESSHLPTTPAHPIGLENRVAELEELTHRLLAEINQLRGRPEHASQHNTPPPDPCD